MPKPKRPSDLLTANNFWMEVPGLVSPHFESVDGLGIEQGSVTIVDGGSNLTYKFPDNIINFTDLTLTRTDDGSSDDAALEALYQQCTQQGFKFDCTLVKYHKGQEAYRLTLMGFRFTNMRYPALATESRDKHQKTFEATVDMWFKV